MDIQVFLNDTQVEGTIMFSYFSFERDVEVQPGQEELYEREYHQCPFLCHRDLTRVWSSDLITRIKQNVGLWRGVKTIKFVNDLVCFGYRAFDEYDNLVIAKLIPISNLCELNIYSNLNDDVIEEHEKRKKFLSEEEAEQLK